MTEAIPFEIRGNVTEIEIKEPYDTTFKFPPFGPSTYLRVMNQIDSAGLKRPTFKDHIVLTHVAWQNRKEWYFNRHITQIAEPDSHSLIADTAVLVVPERIYTQDHPKPDKTGWPIMNEEELISKLESGDTSVRCTEHNYQDGKSIKDLKNNSFIQALVGDQDIVKLLAEVADRYESKLYLWPLGKIDEPTILIPTLHPFGDPDPFAWGAGYWLCISGIATHTHKNFRNNNYAYGIEA